MQVADYCQDRIHFALAEEIERIKEELCERNTGEGRQVQWEKVFVDCYLKVDGEVKGKVSRPVVGSSSDEMVLEAVSPETVGSTAVVALVCSSHIIVSNCGDSRAVLLRGKDSMPLSVDHKVKESFLSFNNTHDLRMFLYFISSFCSQIERMSMQE